jgi:Holliday junction DNA helicase RuvA
MIAKLTGIVDSIYEESCIIDVGGVGYLVFASSRTLSKLKNSEKTTLYIETVVREDSISLFGFTDTYEKEWFLTLTKVQGVGSKVALSILSVLTPLQLAAAVSAQDKNIFLRASGVGPKLASRLITELKGKIVTPQAADIRSTNTLPDDESTPSVLNNTQNDELEDVISALINLGYQRIEAYQAASKVCALHPNQSLSELIRLSLKEFARKDI